MQPKNAFFFLFLFLVSCGQSRQPIYVQGNDPSNSSSTSTSTPPDSSNTQAADEKERKRLVQEQEQEQLKQVINDSEVETKNEKDLVVYEEFFCTENVAKSDCKGCEELSFRVKRYGPKMKCTLMSQGPTRISDQKNTPNSKPALKSLGTRGCQVIKVVGSNHYRIETEDKEEMTLTLIGNSVPNQMTFEGEAIIRFDTNKYGTMESNYKNEFFNCSKLTQDIVNLPNWTSFDK